VIVTEIDKALVGVLVDAVTGVIRSTSANLQTLSRHARTAGSNYLEVSRSSMSGWWCL
jgi:chemotaxis signal transduction protein